MAGSRGRALVLVLLCVQSHVNALPTASDVSARTRFKGSAAGARIDSYFDMKPGATLSAASDVCLDEETLELKETALAQSEDMAAAVVRAAIGVSEADGAKYDMSIARAQHTDADTFAWKCNQDHTKKLLDKLQKQAQVAKEVSVNFAGISILTKRLQCIVNSGLKTLTHVQVGFYLPFILHGVNAFLLLPGRVTCVSHSSTDLVPHVWPCSPCSTRQTISTPSSRRSCTP